MHINLSIKLFVYTIASRSDPNLLKVRVRISRISAFAEWQRRPKPNHRVKTLILHFAVLSSPLALVFRRFDSHRSILRYSRIPTIRPNCEKDHSIFAPNVQFDSSSSSSCCSACTLVVDVQLRELDTVGAEIGSHEVHIGGNQEQRHDCRQVLRR